MLAAQEGSRSLAVRLLQAAFGAALAAGSLACSKENNVDASTDVIVGQQCAGADDTGCGVGGVCALGVCRLGCTVDAECDFGALCVGDRAPYGCSTASELACSNASPCTPPLACAIDGKCRNPCGAGVACPRNELSCIAGACVSDSDPEPLWHECNEGNEHCGNNLGAECSGADCARTRYGCHINGKLGWSVIEVCGTLCTEGTNDFQSSWSWCN